ncbi:hypothetical protein F0562_017845 [Nyssa sinensis]|uniref:Non-haem dioxygenase N-terminal domain-containing protein n=1 Tax=Nyssa sinensis TaxID=561372 RepID=A0A5J4ZG41_9ASTE|nr:hypothetical protein F0562_017845 [Nyssa sinensis]
MAIMRTKSLLSSPAPPPSPIPTGKGVRSAADSTFSEYIDKSIQIPELILPECLHRLVPANIDYQSLVSRDGDSVKRLLRSAAEFGVIRISGHGILADQIRSTLDKTESVFRISDGRKTEYCRHYVDSEEFVWRRSDIAMAEKCQDVLAAEKYRSFSQEMENVTSKLEAIAEELALVISENASKQPRKKIQPRESILSLYRYNRHSRMDQNPSLSNEEIRESCGYALSLHLIVEQCEFSVQSESSSMSFNTSPDTIVVTIGEQLEEWSLGVFKSASEQVICEPKLHGSRPSFSVELKCWPKNFNHGHSKINKTISIADQILIILLIAFLYKIFVFISFA